MNSLGRSDFLDQLLDLYAAPALSAMHDLRCIGFVLGLYGLAPEHHADIG
jgi:hypothetical protein